MAFKRIDRGGMKPAVRIDKQNKTVTGYLTGLRFTPKTKKREPSAIFEFTTTKGEIVNVWGSSDINRNLLDETGKGLEPAFMRCLTRLTFKSERKVKGYKLPFRDIAVEIDTTEKFVDTRPEYKLKRK